MCSVIPTGPNHELGLALLDLATVAAKSHG